MAKYFWHPETSIPQPGMNLPQKLERGLPHSHVLNLANSCLLQEIFTRATAYQYAWITEAEALDYTVSNDMLDVHNGGALVAVEALVNDVPLDDLTKARDPSQQQQQALQGTSPFELAGASAPECPIVVLDRKELREQVRKVWHRWLYGGVSQCNLKFRRPTISASRCSWLG
jgi:hypothetical protein